MKLPSFARLLSAFSTAILRFPLTMLAAVLAVVALLVMIEKNGSELLSKIWMMAQLGIPLFIGLSTLAESKGWSWKGLGGLIQIFGIVALVLYGWSLPDLNAPDFETVHIIRYGVLLLVIHLFVSFAPYLNQYAIAHFWEFNKQLFANFIIGAAYAAILWAGLSLAILAVDQLFQLQLNGKIYLQLYVLLIGIFNTTFFLHHFPVEYEYTDLNTSYTQVFKTLCKFILIPIVTLYFVILYAYSAKILISWALPVGWVASLVIGFSIAGILTYLLNYRLPAYDNSPIASNYRRWFWWVMLPMIAMLFVAISRRIMDYGITEERFFVTHIGFWLLLTGSYFVFSKTDNIKFVPISLAVFGLTAVLGPLSAFNVAVRSQKGILEQLLTQNGRLEAGKIVKGNNLLPEKDGKTIISALDFLEKRHQLSTIQNWLPMPVDSLYNGSKRPVDQVADLMNIHWEKESLVSDAYVRAYASPAAYQGNIGDYTLLYQLDLSEYSDTEESRFFTINKTKDGLALLETTKRDTTTVEEFFLGFYLKEWFRKSENGAYVFPPGKSVVEMKGKKYDLKLIINALEFNPEGDHFEITQCTGIALLREKRSK